MLPDEDACYRAVSSRDARFDGWFFTAVSTTGIYCRPSCPATTPRRRNTRFFPSAAAAQRNGFRACKRCRPDASPGSPDWDTRADLAGRAVRLIADGAVDRDGVPGLARRLGYSERQLNRTLLAEVGAGPLALARSHRAQTARVLLETTAMSAADIAFAAGFASVRQFNDTVREVFATTPSALRASAGGSRDSGSAGGSRDSGSAGGSRDSGSAGGSRDSGSAGGSRDSGSAGGSRDSGSAGSAGTIDLRLAHRRPMDSARTLRWLGAHAVAGVESFEETVDGPVFTRTLRLPYGPGRVAVTAGGETWVRATLQLTDQRDLTAAVSRVRRLFDLDADPQAVDVVLGADPDLAPLVRARPGLRAPGAVDGPETAIRTVVGQQVSLAGARTVLARIVAAHGDRVFDDEPGWLFPDPATLASIDPVLLPVPRSRARATVAVATAVDHGALVLDVGADRATARRSLLDIVGVGPWTADYVVMRALGDPDILLGTDLAARKVAAELGIDLPLATGVAGHAGHPWAPWRTYATHHLWAVVLDRLKTPKTAPPRPNIPSMEEQQ